MRRYEGFSRFLLFASPHLASLRATLTIRSSIRATAHDERDTGKWTTAPCFRSTAHDERDTGAYTRVWLCFRPVCASTRVGCGAVALPRLCPVASNLLRRSHDSCAPARNTPHTTHTPAHPFCLRSALRPSLHRSCVHPSAGHRTRIPHAATRHVECTPCTCSMLRRLPPPPSAQASPTHVPHANLCQWQYFILRSLSALFHFSLMRHHV